VTARRACCAALELADWKLWSPCLSRLPRWAYDVGRPCVFGRLLCCRISEQAVLLSVACLELSGSAGRFWGECSEGRSQ
jgi:hypothetical protein